MLTTTTKHTCILKVKYFYKIFRVRSGNTIGVNRVLT